MPQFSEIALLFLGSLLAGIVSFILNEAQLRWRRARLASISQVLPATLVARFHSFAERLDRASSAASVVGLLAFPVAAHFGIRALLHRAAPDGVVLTPGLQLMAIPHMITGAFLAIWLHHRVALAQLARRDPELRAHFSLLFAAYHGWQARLYSPWLVLPVVFLAPTLGLANFNTVIDSQGIHTWSPSSALVRTTYPLSSVTDLVLVEYRAASGRRSGFRALPSLPISMRHEPR